MIAWRIPLCSFWATSPPRGASRFPSPRQKSTSSNALFLGYPEVAQFHAGSTRGSCGVARRGPMRGNLVAGELGGEQGSQEEVDVVDRLVLVGVVCRHPLYAGADALHRLYLPSWGVLPSLSVWLLPLALHLPSRIQAPSTIAVVSRIASSALGSLPCPAFSAPLCSIRSPPLSVPLTFSAAARALAFPLPFSSLLDAYSSASLGPCTCAFLLCVPNHPAVAPTIPLRPCLTLLDHPWLMLGQRDGGHQRAGGPGSERLLESHCRAAGKGAWGASGSFDG